jgi:hypothetical protein
MSSKRHGKRHGDVYGVLFCHHGKDMGTFTVYYFVIMGKHMNSQIVYAINKNITLTVYI